MNFDKRYFRSFFLLVSTVCLLSSCQKGAKPVQSVDIGDVDVQMMFDATTRYTDSGRLKMIMETQQLENFKDEQRTQLFRKGVIAKFFGENKSLTKELHADSAINLQESKLMKFYKNVVIYDYAKGDTLYTEALYWDQDKRIIYSDKRVKQITPHYTLVGDGMDADDEMKEYRLRNPRGVF